MLQRRPVERRAAVDAINQLPRSRLGQGEGGAAGEGHPDVYAKTVEANQRSEQNFVELTQLGMELATLAGNAGVRKELRSLGVSVFVVKTVREQLRYDTQPPRGGKRKPSKWSLRTPT